MPVPRPVFDFDADSNAIVGEMRVSADDHFGEPLDLWETRLPEKFRDGALKFPDLALYETNHHLRAGGWDPYERMKDLALDQTSATVLYPTLGANVWRIKDPALEGAHIRTYNDFCAEYCKTSPDRYWGLAMVGFNEGIDVAVEEVERAKKNGLRGLNIPMIPKDDLRYDAEYFEKFWDAAERNKMPLAIHINTGPGHRDASGQLPYGVSKFDPMKDLGDFIVSGVLERHPNLKVIFSETGAGWLPFYAQEFDYYMMGTGRQAPKIPRPPSEYIDRQVFATFIGDRVAGSLAEEYGANNFLWSSDYPHPACTWPNSGMIIAQDLGHLSKEVRTKIICQNVCDLYNDGKLPPAMDESKGDHQSLDSWTLSLRLPGTVAAGGVGAANL